MMLHSTRIRLWAWLLWLGLWSAPAFAQGCAMCYANAKGAPKEGQRALNRAILILLAPPAAAMTLGVNLAFHYGKKRDQDHDSHP